MKASEIQVGQAIEKSKGHLGFLGTWEFYEDAIGDMYRAPISNPVMPDGYRCGRFEATAATAAAALRLAVEVELASNNGEATNNEI